jgi:prepilin signal peptidase PulO-like enzyme (type II secretory pathway)
MDFLYLTFFVILFLLVSSFLNVVALRLPKGESIAYPPSHCIHCEHHLHTLDLIPILSYLFLKGRCRYCRAHISFVYPFGEALTTTILLITYLMIGLNKELLIALPLVAMLCTISISDLLYQVIPNKVNVAGFIYFLVLHFFYSPQPFTNYLWGVAAGGGVLLILALVSRGGMGGGDIKLMAVVGVAIGWKLTLLALFLASLIGGAIGVVLLSLKIVGRKQPIPFGPFLALGTFISYLWGDEMIHAYIWYFIGA